VNTSIDEELELLSYYFKPMCISATERSDDLKKLQITKVSEQLIA